MFERIKKWIYSYLIERYTADKLIEKIEFEMSEFEDVQAVKEFHEFYGHTVRETTDGLTQKEMSTRVLLLLEEIVELAEASGTDAIRSLRLAMGEYCNKIENSYLASKKSWLRIFASPKNEHWKEVPLNIVEVQDALTDIRYYLAGTVLIAGLGTYDKKAFYVVHENNMSKHVVDEEIAAMTIKDYALFDIEAKYERVLHPDGYYTFVIKCVNDPKGVVPTGKILKPINYKKVDLSSVFGEKAPDA